ncbi:hypothetical protein [Primorskyibacter sp. S187A]|uniref:hypothetical protein n=1 Tax=Primorskyibacter sp. S187A TaxID=3415130 RepID=UPI003C7C5942
MKRGSTVKYLATLGVFLIFGAVLMAADFYERAKANPDVTSFTAYRDDLSGRVEKLTGGMIGGTAPTAQRGGYSAPEGEVESDVALLAGGIKDIIAPNGTGAKPSYESYTFKGKIKSVLPEAPEGWTRRLFDMDDTKRLPGFAGILEERQAMMGLPTDRAMMRIRQNTTWMYESGEKLVQMTAINRQKASGRVMEAGLIDQVTTGRGQSQVFYAAVQGVVWTKQRTVHWTERAEDGPEPVILTGRLGSATIYVKGFMADEELPAFLEGIDYDALNNMLKRPFPNVGSNAPELTPEQEQAAFEAELAERKRLDKVVQENAEEQSKKSNKRFWAMSKAIGATDQLSQISADQFNAMGLPNRELQGDYSVLPPEEISRIAKTLTAENQRTFGFYFAQVILEQGLDWDDVHIAVDGNTANAAEEAAAYAVGTLPESAPTYLIRVEEAKRGLPPGACLQIRAGGMFCGDLAEKARFLWEFPAQRNAAKAQKEAARKIEIDRRKAEREQERTQQREQRRAALDLKKQQKAAADADKPVEVKINRHSGGRLQGSRGGCGGTSFCRVTSD